MALQQFIAKLPKGTAEWVQCHRPLDEAVQLAKDHLASYPGAVSPSLVPCCPSPSPPSFQPIPFPQKQWNNQCPGLRGCANTPVSLSPGSTHSSSQVGEAAATGVGMRFGPVSWSCSEPGHVREQCLVMEVGKVIRVPDTPQAAPDRARTYQMPTDASDRGLGAVLSQVVEGEECPVLYISRKLSMRKTKYSTIEECLAIKWEVLTLCYYLLGRAFTLCSDHAPLQWLHRMKDTNGI
ncbi:uncharacterized protein LOC127450935 [Myxocyprinus asiaticus]|uniref:uncharacterized protein LOC127450935 n=1 Tax=Myxocyprinus asiaticus TaxID=70543 RepID=UPI0022237EE0|nr:uncharacterized protein LOC127450935 [Myxocyprinus asiaticus]